MNTRHYIRKTGAWTLTAVLCLMALCGCDDSFIYDGGGTSTTSGGRAYMTLTLSMVDAGTRSTTNTLDDADYGTSSDGTETALSSETKVNSVLVVFTTAESSLTGSDPYPILEAYTSSDIKANADGTYDVGIDLPEDTNLSSATNMFVFCNPTDAQVASAMGSNQTWTAKDTYTLSNATDDTPWAAGNMFLESAVLSKVNFPTDLGEYDESNPLVLGEVKVERAVARFDYKDGAPDPENAPFTYTVLSHKNSEGETVPQINVELQEVALFNMSKDFYHLRQGCSGSSSSASSQPLLKEESSSSWVCDPNYTSKNTNPNSSSKYPTFNEYSIDIYNYSLYYPSSWGWTKLSDLSQDGVNDGYKVWRYVTESCPTGKNYELRGNTTGVVFKGEMTAPEGSDYVESMKEGLRLYHFDNYLFDSWNAVSIAAEAEEEEWEDSGLPGYFLTNLYDAYTQVINVWTRKKRGEEFDETDEDVMQAMAGAGFTGYAPETDATGNYHYYVYYYYWNRHNNNDDNTSNGAMEFAVVRNNVYALSVTGITELGHPEPADYTDTSFKTTTMSYASAPDANPVSFIETCDRSSTFNVGLYMIPWIKDHDGYSLDFQYGY